MTAWQCPPAPEKARLVRFPCPELDESLGKCLRRGNVVEFSGEAGSGKTQLVLHLGLETARAGSKVLFVQTEGAFPSKRVGQILHHNGWNQSVSDRIIVETNWERESVIETLEKKVPQLIERIGNFGLIIVDSVAGALRSEYEADKKFERSRDIHKLGTLLTSLAVRFDIPVVVTNQVTAVIDQPQENFGRRVLPCFGLSWSNYVNTRIFVARTESVVAKSDNKSPEMRLRTADVDFSPVLPNIKANFVVDNHGVRGVRIKQR